MAEEVELRSELVSYFKVKSDVIRKRWVGAMQTKGLLEGLTDEER